VGADPTERFPPYSYVPGGPWPHPTRSPAGHSYRKAEQAGARARETIESTFGRGAALFNAGYYWEAHEVWEALWHAAGRHGARALVLKGLIKLAAAGVKARERRIHGVRTHARRAAECFAASREQGGEPELGLDLEDWIKRAQAIAESPPVDPGPRGAPVTRVFAFTIAVAQSGRRLDDPITRSADNPAAAARPRPQVEPGRRQ
jgi:hypothetical protein